MLNLATQRDKQMKRDRLQFPITAVLIAFIWLSALGSSASSMSEVASGERGSHIALRLGARAMGRAAPRMPIKGSIYFRLNNEEELDRLLAEQHDTVSASYQRWLTPQEFGRRFGAPADVRDSALDWLRQAGINVTRVWLNGLGVEFESPADLVERTFRVRIGLFDLAGQTFYANENESQLPSGWGASVETVRLHNLRVPRSGAIERQGGIAPAFRSGETVSIGPHDFYVAYNLLPLLADGIDGSGQTIAILGRSDFDLSDPAKYREMFALPPGEIVKIPAGSEIKNVGGGDEIEMLLDSQLAGMAAPLARIQVVICDKDSDVDQSLAFAVNNLPDTKVINLSFGACERDLGPTFQSVFNNLYKQAAAQGQTVLVSSGDNGAADCGDGTGRQVNGLAASPFVTAVGGTSLNVSLDAGGNVTAYRSERTWNGSGGGASLVYPRPSYQLGLGSLEGNARTLPDVALLGDPESPGFFFVRHASLRVVGGTSASAPGWAGILALANQFAHASGLGCANARLYQLGTAGQQGGPAVFNDVTEGSNDQGSVTGFPAVSGYDLSTGWGSPNADLFVRNFASIASGGNEIFLLRPNGGEFFVSDTVISINWRISEAFAALVSTQDVLLSTDGGSTFAPIVSSLGSQVRSFDLVLPDLVTTTARFRISARTESGALVTDGSDTDINIGTRLRIESARYSPGSKRLELLGSGFAREASLVINGTRLELKPKSSAEDSLTLKGKKKKLKLKTGENQIIVEVDGVRSSPYRLFL